MSAAGCFQGKTTPDPEPGSPEYWKLYPKLDGEPSEPEPEPDLPDFRPETQTEYVPPEHPPTDPYLIFKEKAMKCKLISLDEMGHNPLTDPATFSKREQKKVLDKMKIWFAKPDEEMQQEFDEIVRDKLFDDKGGMDYTKFPIEDNRVTYDTPLRKRSETMTEETMSED